MKKQLLFFLFVFICCFSFAQQKQIDSLKQIIGIVEEDTNKVNCLHKLCILLQNTGDFNAALEDEKQMLALSKKLNWKKGIAKAYNSIGCIYAVQANYPEALKNHYASKAMYEEMGERPRLAANYHNIGIVHADQGNYPEALKNFFTALKINEETGNKSWEANNLNYIGIVYENQLNYPEALKNYLKSLKIKEELGDKKGVSDCYNNIGDVYHDQKNYTEALKNHFAALKIRLEIGDKDGIATSYGNIGENYTKQARLITDPSKKQELLNEALKNGFAAKKIFEEIMSKIRLAAINTNIGSTYFELRNYKEAEIYCLKSLAIAKEIGNLQWLQSANEHLSELYAVTSRYKGALEYYKASITARDSLNNEGNTKKTVQMQMNYEFDKKETTAKLEQEKKDAIAGEESRKQKIIIAAVSLGLLLVLILALIVFRSLRINQKKNRIIHLQKEQVEKQKQIVEEKQKEIIDSITYARRIQQALITNEKYIEKSLNKLLNKKG